jgi:hypothetical protein
LEALLAEAGFDADTYRQASADLAVLDSDDAATVHFLAHGVFERRCFPIDLNVRAIRELGRMRVRRPGYPAEIRSALCHAYAQGLPRDDPATFADGAGRIATLRDMGCRPFLLVGDSHSDIFRRSSVGTGTWLTPLHLSCSAGSARSLGNPASRSGYGRRIAAHAQALSTAGISLPILIQFGQVDVEFVSIFHRVRDGLPRLDMAYYERFCEEVVEAYIAFLLRTFDRRDDVLVLSIFPPALSDEQWHEGYINAHVMGLEGDRDAGEMRRAISRLEIPTLRQRTEIHACFNARLERSCRQSGLRYVNVFDGLLDGDLLDRRYGPATRVADHHLDYPSTGDFASRLLFELTDPHMG